MTSNYTEKDSERGLYFHILVSLSKPCAKMTHDATITIIERMLHNHPQFWAEMSNNAYVNRGWARKQVFDCGVTGGIIVVSEKAQGHWIGEHCYTTLSVILIDHVGEIQCFGTGGMETTEGETMGLESLKSLLDEKCQTDH